MNTRKEASPRLGRGLASLLGDIAVPAPTPLGSVREIPLDLLEPNPFQPRTTMDPTALDELASSIRVQGVLQPLLVRPHPTASGRYQIVAGERRWRAAAAAGLHQVPTLVREMADTEAAAVALVENLQRQDLNPIDEAEGYSRLIEQFGLTQEALGQAVGKSRSHVTNMLRLLNLPDAVKAAARKGEITAGHARALLAHPRPEMALLDVIGRGLSVRQTEDLAARREPNPSGADLRGPTDSPDAIALERHLGEQLGLRVKVNFNGNGGFIQIYYTDLDQLDTLIKILVPN
jgi:ParB family transcriptional regulator, chromosome partitioning protein